MNEKSLHQKQQILNWLLSLEDEVMISKIDDFCKALLSHQSVSEPQTEFNVKDDFDERFAKGLTSDELLTHVFQHIDSLPWTEQ